MKQLIASLALAAIAACPLASFAQADIESDPAYLPINKVLDLKATPPQVDVNLPRFLLKDVLSNLNNTNLGDSSGDRADLSKAELADLVKDVKLIRVLVFEGTQSNRTALANSIKALRAELDEKWTAIVNVKDEGDHVGVYVKGDASGDSVAGLAVLVHDAGGGDTVIVNVVGHVSIGKLMKFASQANKLPKGLLQQLSSAGVLPAGPPASKEKKTESSAGTNTSLESPESPTKDPAK